MHLSCETLKYIAIPLSEVTHILISLPLELTLYATGIPNNVVVYRSLSILCMPLSDLMLNSLYDSLLQPNPKRSLVLLNFNFDGEPQWGIKYKD